MLARFIGLWRGFAVAQSNGKQVMHSTFFNWADLKVTTYQTRRTPLRVRRTTRRNTPGGNLNATSRPLTPASRRIPPHHHPEEELLVIKEGTVAAMQNGVTNIVTAGGIIFQASNEEHGLVNIGTNRATYYVFKILPHDLAK